VDRDPVWFHGDIARGNLLVREVAHAVIDFGSIGVGDPARSRDRGSLRPHDVSPPAALDVDDATWIGPRMGPVHRTVGAPVLLAHQPPMVAQARYKLAEVLAETT
jgi:hypothetical protein